MCFKLNFTVPTKSVFNSISPVVQYDESCNPNEMSVSYEKYLTNAHIFKPGGERKKKKKKFSNENLYILEVNSGVTVHLLLHRWW